MTTQTELTPAELSVLEKNVDKMSDAELRAWLDRLDTTIDVVEKENCQESFMDFVHRVWPDFIDGAHHNEMAEIGRAHV